MFTLPIETVAAGATVNVAAGTPNTVGAVVLYNESPNLVRVTWGSSSDWLPAWTGDCFYMNQNGGFNGTFGLTGQAISSAGNAPSSVVAGKVYAPGEQVPGTYPVALVRQTNVGNSTLPTTGSSSVINDGNAKGTTVVEATQQGQTTSSLNLLNDGTALLAPVSAGALLDALVVTPGDATNKATGSFGDAANPGNWNVYGTVASATNATNATNLTGGSLTATGAASLDSGNITSNGSGSLTATKFLGQVHGQVGNSSWNGQSIVNASGSGTFAHSLGAVPNMYSVICTTANSSQTQGIDTPTSTTVHITSGAGLAFFCYLARAS